MTNGIILVDKPSGLSSAAVIARVKKQSGVAKIGHAGTLDPMATGLLICLVGGCTRLAGYAEAGLKRYTGEFVFGLRTDTDDVTGQVIERHEVKHTISQLEDAVSRYRGTISQIPPQVSAIKIDGQRCYDLVRGGQEVEIAPRTVTIERFEIRVAEPSVLTFDITCSKGTYIRSLARDIGADLGCGGSLKSLRRAGSHPFDVRDALPLEAIGPGAVRSWTELFPSVPQLSVTARQEALLRNGDGRTLTELGSSLDVAADKAIYKAELSGVPLGLMVKRAEGWGFGVNLAAN